MDKISLRDRIVDFFMIPGEIRTEFLQETVQKNKLSIFVVCIIIFFTEIYNILRVLLWSDSRLATLNNRIYFGMYCALLIVAILWLTLQYTFRNESPKIQWVLQYTTTLLIFLWHILLNSYDLMKSPDGRTVVFTTAILALSIFIQMPSLFSIICFSSGYFLFYFLSGSFLTIGDILNLTITFFVALSVSITNSHHAVVNLCQRREIIQINYQLQELVKRDPLTGLFNKGAMERELKHHLEKNANFAGGTLFLFDLDDFKRINDNFGHPGGDYVLMQVALKMRAIFPEDSMLGRIGGDEFAAFIDHVIDENTAQTIGNRFIESISDFHWNGQAMNTSCSIGICACRHSRISYERLYKETDCALYLAKRSGKRKCSFHTI